eukprot:5173943-Pyramimonas_sp.AAC.1
MHNIGPLGCPAVSSKPAGAKVHAVLPVLRSPSWKPPCPSCAGRRGGRLGRLKTGPSCLGRFRFR